MTAASPGGASQADASGSSGEAGGGAETPRTPERPEAPEQPVESSGIEARGQSAASSRAGVFSQSAASGSSDVPPQTAGTAREAGPAGGAGTNKDFVDPVGLGRPASSNGHQISGTWGQPGVAQAEPAMVALDIDGTLTQFGLPISQPVREAVGALREAGIHVLLATGRNVEGMMVAARQLGLDDEWAVCSNGAVIVRLDGRLAAGFEIVETSLFDPGPTLHALQTAVPTAGIAVEVPGDGYLVNELFPHGELIGREVVKTIDQMAARLVPRVVVRANELSAEELVRIIDEAHVPHVDYAVGWTAWVDFTGANISKASGLESMRQRLGVSADRTVAIGDGDNDIAMVVWAAHGVAMGNAVPAVLEVADEVTATVDEAGAALAMRRALADLR